MLSRCASLEQLTIVDLDNIRVDEDVQAETINNKPCYWMNPKAAGLKVSSLRRHFDTSKVILPCSKVIYFACRSYGCILEKKRENITICRSEE